MGLEEGEEFGDSGFGGGVSAEEGFGAVGGEGHDDEHVGGGGGDVHGDALVSGIEFFEGVDEALGAAGDLGAGFVGGEFSRTGDGEADEHGGEGSEDDHEEHADEAKGSGVAVVSAAAEPEHHASDGSDAAGHDDGDGGDEDVAVFDVGEFVGDDAFEFGGGHHGHEAFGDADDAVGGVAAGGEGVGGLLVGEVEAGHGEVGALGEALDDFVEFGGLFLGDGLGMCGGEGEFVAEEVGGE